MRKKKPDKPTKEERLKRAYLKYPDLFRQVESYHPTPLILKFCEAVEKYPDLKSLPVKLATIAYDFREEMLREYVVELNFEIANAHSRIRPGGFKPPLSITEDLPAFSFDKECVSCRAKKKCISICPSCWQKTLSVLLQAKQAGIAPIASDPMGDNSNNVMGWTIRQGKDGYYRLYKNVEGETACIYLGKKLDKESARIKIAMWRRPQTPG